MDKTEKFVVKCLVGILLVFAITIGYFANLYAPYVVSPFATGAGGPGATPPPAGSSDYAYNGRGVGTFTMKDNAYNALDISAALTLATNVDQYWYSKRGGLWKQLGGHGASGTDVELTEADGEIIYMMCAPHSTQTYVLNVAKTLDMNPRSISADFTDATGDGVNEFMIGFDMTDVPKAASGYPSVTFTGYYYYEDSASTTDGGPSDIVVGTALNTTSVEWYLTISATKRALPWYKIQIRMNTTTLSEAKVKSVDVPGVGTVAESALTYWYDSTYQYFEYKGVPVMSGHLGDCRFIAIEALQTTKIYLTTSIQTDLASNDVECVMTVFELSYADGVVTDTDTVNLTAS